MDLQTLISGPNQDVTASVRSTFEAGAVGGALPHLAPAPSATGLWRGLRPPSIKTSWDAHYLVFALPLAVFKLQIRFSDIPTLLCSSTPSVVRHSLLRPRHYQFQLFDPGAGQNRPFVNKPICVQRSHSFYFQQLRCSRSTEIAMNKFVLAAALVGSTALAQNVASGKAIVVNKCNYPVHLVNVPAAGQGGVEEDPAPLQPGDSWSQHYTGLSRGDGWSIKLSKSADYSADNILQFEYTYQPNQNSEWIWVDVSSVNGGNNPWACEGWTVAASEPCRSDDGIKQAAAYMYSTDDTWGMQPQCPSSGDFTLTLCDVPAGFTASRCNFGAEYKKSGIAAAALSLPGDASPSASSSAWGGGVGGAIGSVVGSVVGGVVGGIGSDLFGGHSSSQWSAPTAAPATTAVPTTSAAPTTSTTPTTTVAPSTTEAPAAPTHSTGPPAGGRPPFGNHLVDQNDVDPETDSSSTPNPTTFITAGRTVTALEVAWVTEFITVDTPAPTHAPPKRHVHHGAHEHA